MKVLLGSLLLIVATVAVADNQNVPDTGGGWRELLGPGPRISTLTVDDTNRRLNTGMHYGELKDHFPDYPYPYPQPKHETRKILK